MKLLKYEYLLFIIVALIILSCNKQSDNNYFNVIPAPDNEPPQTNPIELIEVTSNSATIFNSEASDINNDSVYYFLFLNDSLVFSEISKSILYKFENLLPEMTYSVELFITDSINEVIELPFSFTTNVYENHFDNMYYNLDGDTRTGSSIETTSDGGYILLAGINQGSPYPYIVKLDSLGIEQWSKSYHIEDLFANTFMGEIIESKSGEYVAVFESIVIKINSTGDLVWYHIDSEYEYNAVIETVEGDYVLTGRKGSKGSINKLSSNGEIIWNQTIEESHNIWFSSICNSYTNDFMVLGWKYNPGSTGINGSNAFFITHIDTNGQIIYIKEIENNPIIFSENIIQSSDGSYFISGWNDDAVIIKINKSSEILWEFRYKASGFYETFAKSIALSNNNGVVFCGSNASRYSNEAILVEVSESGQMVNQMVFKPDFSDYTWSFYDLKQTYDGDYIMTGIKSWVWNGTGKPNGLWVKKTSLQ